MKRAPFLCKQSPDRTLEVVILAGSLAWETSRAWRKDPDREDDVPRWYSARMNWPIWII